MMINSRLSVKQNNSILSEKKLSAIPVVSFESRLAIEKETLKLQKRSCRATE